MPTATLAVEEPRPFRAATVRERQAIIAQLLVCAAPTFTKVLGLD